MAVASVAGRPPALVAGLVLGRAVTQATGLLEGASFSGGTDSPPGKGSVDVGLSRDMRKHHTQAVQMSVLAREATEDPEVRTLALDILLTQQQAGQMCGWLSAWNVAQASPGPPIQDHDQTAATGAVSVPGMAGREDLDRLARAERRQAERLYLQLMVHHHQGGVAMAEEAALRAEEPQVRRLAKSIVGSQTSQIAVLLSMLAARGGPADGS